MKEFTRYIETLCIAYLRKDRIEKYDTEQEFTNELYLTSSLGFPILFEQEPLYNFSDDNAILESKSTYLNGYIIFDNFKLNFITNIYSAYNDVSFCISHPYEHKNIDEKHVYLNEIHEVPEKFNTLFNGI